MISRVYLIVNYKELVRSKDQGFLYYALTKIFILKNI